MNILDHISESLERIFWVKILKFFDEDADLDAGSGTLDPGPGMGKIRIRDKHPGSATLPSMICFILKGQRREIKANLTEEKILKCAYLGAGGGQ
jgi:hypothetical protein